MPPRYAYWTILIDNKPTAFRAREKEELLPTFQQLRRTNKDVVMKWFARGRLWESRDEERDSWQRRKAPAGVTPERRGAKASTSWASRDREKEKRGRDWRPGGQHKDPRDRFKKKNRPERAWSEGARKDSAGHGAQRPGRDRPASAPHGDRPWRNKPPGNGPRGDRPWSKKPPGAGSGSDRPWSNRPGGHARGGFRPRSDAPRNLAPERRNSEAPPKPATHPRAAPPPRSEPTVKKPEPPERG